MEKKNLVIELTEQQKQQINEATNYLLKELILEFNSESNSFDFKGVLFEKDIEDKSDYIKKVKISMPCQDHDGNP